MINSNILYLLAGVGYPESAPIGSYTPSLDVFGSYFPAWLICLMTGVILTICVSLIGRVFNPVATRLLVPLVPISLILIFSITTWLLFFST
jgi:hypothetical protein